MNAEKIALALDGTRSDSGWMAHCPAHEDGTASLSISEGNDGKILFYCHTGCAQDEVLAELKELGLWPKKGRSKSAKAPPPWERLIEAEYNYLNAGDFLIYQVVRFGDGWKPKFLQRQPNDEDGWDWNLKGIETVLYHLPQILESKERGKTIFITEGEKDADNLLENLNLTATCNPSGAGKWKESYTNTLEGAAQLVILPDNDPAGRKHATKVANALYGKFESLKVVELPNLPYKGDVSNWIEDGGTCEDLESLVEQANEWEPQNELEQKQETGGKKPSQSEILVGIASSDELFHTPQGDGYATVQAESHLETWPIRNSGYRDWLIRRFYIQFGKGPSNNSFQEALSTIEARAKIDGPESEVFTRIGESNGAIYLNLADPKWSVVEITADGWGYVSDPPVKFRQPKGMARLPHPVSGGSIEDLRSLINAPEDENWRLIVGWLVAAFRPKGPFPVLILQGEQGSTKSTAARVLKKLIDPSIAPLRTIPRDEHNLLIAASNGWVLPFDNMSFMKPWLSDAFCRLATGGGFSTRQLYTDSEEIIFEAMRPIILNGITDIAFRNDLIDRAVIVTLPKLDDKARLTENEFWRKFESARPKLLGALLDAVSTALSRIDDVHIEALPRMADFAHWVVAAEPALPWEIGGFMEAYQANIEDSIEVALESDPVADAVRELVAIELDWTGTMGELLEELRGCDRVKDQVLNSKAWPKNPRALSGRIRRAAPFLRTIGIEFEKLQREPGTGGRLFRLVKRENRIDPDQPESAKTLISDGRGNEYQGDGGDAHPNRMTPGDMEPTRRKRPSNAETDGRDDCDAKKHKDSVVGESNISDDSLKMQMLRRYRDHVKESRGN